MRRAPIHRLSHTATRKRRLIAGVSEIAIRREERLRRLAEGKPLRRRKLAAGKSGVAIRREERMRKLAEGTGGPARYALSRKLKGEFRGENRDPRIRRK